MRPTIVSTPVLFHVPEVRLQCPIAQALVAQRIEHLTTDQKVGSSNLSERAT